MAKAKRLDSFEFKEGIILDRCLEVVEQIGEGWEGEVYLVRELDTGVEFAAKFYFPMRNPKGKTSIQFAKRLHKLKNSPIMPQFYGHRKIVFKGEQISFVLIEFVEGPSLTDVIASEPGKRFNEFTALHLLRELAIGLESLHLRGEYHGDLHSDNIIVPSFGLRFEMKFIDLYTYPAANKKEIRGNDIAEIIRCFYEALGGKKHYSKLSDEVKYICGGLKQTLILKRFPTASALRNHLENLRWLTV